MREVFGSSIGRCAARFGRGGAQVGCVGARAESLLLRLCASVRVVGGGGAQVGGGGARAESRYLVL